MLGLTWLEEATLHRWDQAVESEVPFPRVRGLSEKNDHQAGLLVVSPEHGPSLVLFPTPKAGRRFRKKPELINKNHLLSGAEASLVH